MATLCEALRTNGEMAAFVALSITTIGHTIVDFQVRMILYSTTILLKSYIKYDITITDLPN